MEEDHESNPGRLLKFVQELMQKESGIQDLFAAKCESGAEGVEASLAYMDFLEKKALEAPRDWRQLFRP